MNFEKIKTVSVLKFVPPRHLMRMMPSEDLQYINTPKWTDDRRTNGCLQLELAI